MHTLAFLEPGHFHATLTLRDPSPRVSPEVFVYATAGPELDDFLALHRASPVSAHLEVETYTWDVLPAAYRGVPLAAAIARELNWVKARLGQ